MDTMVNTLSLLTQKLLEITKLPARTLAMIGGGVAAAIVIVLGGWAWFASQERAASEAYSVAFIRAQTALTPSATPADVTAAIAELESVIGRYPSSRQAGQAAYQVGHFQYLARQWERARTAYQLAVAKGLSGPIRTLALDAVGHTWEAERNWPKAIDTYRALLSSIADKDFFAESVLLDLARAQELGGQKDAAIESYRTAFKSFARGPRADEIRSRLASLGVTP